MRNYNLFFQSILLFTIAFFISCSSETQVARIQKNFDFDWKFHRGDFTGVESMERLISTFQDPEKSLQWAVVIQNKLKVFNRKNVQPFKGVV
jgi:hypothetical protein